MKTKKSERGGRETDIRGQMEAFTLGREVVCTRAQAVALIAGPAADYTRDLVEDCTPALEVAFTLDRTAAFTSRSFGAGQGLSSQRVRARR